MQKKFWIYDSWLNDKKMGMLTYDDDLSQFSISVDKNLKPEEAPFIFSYFMQKGFIEIPPDWSLRWG